MASLDLKYHKEDVEMKSGRYHGSAVHDVLRRYLNPPDRNLSMEQASALLEEMVPEIEDPTYGFVAEKLADDILTTAKQIHYSHPSQFLLLRLVQRLQYSTKFGNHWERFHWVVRDGGYDWDVDDTMEPKAKSEVVNMSAFMARASASHTAAGEIYAVWFLRETLETQLRKDNLESYDCLVSASALWILCAGQFLFEEIVTCPRPIQPGDQKLLGGPLYTGPWLGMERWKWWQKALAVIAAEEQAGEECLKLVNKAVDFMDAILRDTSF